MVDVRHYADRRTAGYEYHTSLAGRQFDDGKLALASQKLSIRTGRTRHGGTLTGVEFNVVDDRTQRNLAQEKRIAHFGRHACAAAHRLADLQAVGSDDVALLTVGIDDQRDTRGTIRVVFDRFYSRGNAVLGTLEVYVTVHLLVTAADVANRHLARIVATAGALLDAQQRLLGNAGGNLVERSANLMSCTCGYRLKLFYCHLP